MKRRESQYDRDNASLHIARINAESESARNKRIYDSLPATQQQTQPPVKKEKIK